ncbi:unnamed protein product [Toxocara canis]|nr:unnamed protein product [Toxocara canis]
MSKRNPEIVLDDLESEFDYGSEVDRRKKKSRGEFWDKEAHGEVASGGRSKAKGAFDEEHSRIERQKRRLMALDVYSRHKELINNYYLYYPGATKRLRRDASKDKTDHDVLRERYRFIWDEKELSEAAEKSWEFRLAKRYYDKLFKEYCIADLSHYKKNRIAMRWRVEKEVRSGKGQFECGNKQCLQRENLTSWEVNFGYIEDRVKKNVLVKLRLCPECSSMLNYHSKKRQAERNKPSKKKETRSVSRLPSRRDSCADKYDEPSTSSRSEKTEAQPEVAEECAEAEVDAKLKKEAARMMDIWKKPLDVVDEQKAAEEDFDDFLDDMFM